MNGTDYKRGFPHTWWMLVEHEKHGIGVAKRPGDEYLDKWEGRQRIEVPVPDDYVAECWFDAPLMMAEHFKHLPNDLADTLKTEVPIAELRRPDHEIVKARAADWKKRHIAEAKSRLTDEAVLDLVPEDGTTTAERVARGLMLRAEVCHEQGIMFVDDDILDNSRAGTVLERLCNQGDLERRKDKELPKTYRSQARTSATWVYGRPGQFDIIKQDAEDLEASIREKHRKFDAARAKLKAHLPDAYVDMNDRASMTTIKLDTLLWLVDQLPEPEQTP